MKYSRKVRFCTIEMQVKKLSLTMALQQQQTQKHSTMFCRLILACDRIERRKLQTAWNQTYLQGLLSSLRIISNRQPYQAACIIIVTRYWLLPSGSSWGKTDIYRFHDGRIYIHVFQKVILCLEALNVNISPCSLLQKIFWRNNYIIHD